MIEINRLVDQRNCSDKNSVHTHAVITIRAGIRIMLSALAKEEAEKQKRQG